MWGRRKSEAFGSVNLKEDISSCGEEKEYEDEGFLERSKGGKKVTRHPGGSVCGEKVEKGLKLPAFLFL